MEIIYDIEGSPIGSLLRENKQKNKWIPPHYFINIDILRKSSDRIIIINDKESIPKILEECNLKIYSNVMPYNKYTLRSLSLINKNPKSVYQIGYTAYKLSDEFCFPIEHIPNRCFLLLNLTPQPISNYKEGEYELCLQSEVKGKVISKWIRINLPERIILKKEKHDKIFGERVMELNKKKVIDEANDGRQIANEDYKKDLIFLKKLRDINIKNAL